MRTEGGAQMVSDEIGDVHTLVEDSADHIGQPTIDLVRESFDQNVSNYGESIILEPRRWKYWQWQRMGW